MARKSKDQQKEAGGKSKGGPERARLTCSSEGLLDYAVMHALSNELRVEAFAVLCERVASPKELADELGENLSQVSYHVTVLRQCRMIVLDRKVPRRGAIEHFYRAVTPTLIPPNAWSNLPAAAKSSVSLRILEEFFEDAAAALRAGTFDSDPGELSLVPLILDQPGAEKYGQLIAGFVDSVLELQSEVNKRSAKSDPDASDLIAATMFVAGYPSARDVSENRRASAAKRR